MKVLKSITIDSEVFKEIKKQCIVESRSFSNFVEHVTKKYLKDLKNRS